jgi:hypothetical protein
MPRRLGYSLLGGALIVALTAPGAAQEKAKPATERQWQWPASVEPAPDRRASEGEGPFDRLIIRGATMIDGTGARAEGPVDIVIEKNRIADIRVVGVPGVPIRQANRPGWATREVDATGMYVLPGIFVYVEPSLGQAPAVVGRAGAVPSFLSPRAGGAVAAPGGLVASGPKVDVPPPLTAEGMARYVAWAAEKGVDGFKLLMPNRELHGACFVNWTTGDKIAWKQNFRLWMDFLNDCKNRGGRVTVGSDSAGPFEQFGFEYVRELELMQEAGFTPLEVVRAATMVGAQTLFEPKEKPIEFGILRPGLLADLVIAPLNPLANFKVLYGTGTMRLNDQTGEVEHVGGVRYVVKDGILYDARKLLADVAAIAREPKKKTTAASPSPTEPVR